MTTFNELGLSAELLGALDKVGYSEPTPIQEQAIPALLGGADVIGQAQTGTGKTAAFGLPMLQSIDLDLPEVQGLVLTPTRELCIQVAQSLRAYGAVRGVDVLATFGGAPIRSQMARLKTGPQVVVGTVGRVLDLHGRHALMFHDARFVVLDEADEMLDLGFLEDVELILKRCPNGRQTALFSATMPTAIAKLAERHLHDPVTIKVKAPTLTIDTVDHFKVAVKRNDKIDALIEVLEAERPQQAIVFARTKIGVDRLAKDLDRRKPSLRVRALHGDMSQGSRDGVMISFKEGRIPVLVATDIAARGLDVVNVSHVINYDLPNSAEMYTHRIGRTGRAGRGGRAITLIEPKNLEDMAGIEKHINVVIPMWSAGEAGDSLTERTAARAQGTAGTRRPRSRPEVAELSEQAVEAEAETQADDGAEAIAVETAVESGLTGEPEAPVADDTTVDARSEPAGDELAADEADKSEPAEGEADDDRQAEGEADASEPVEDETDASRSVADGTDESEHAEDEADATDESETIADNVEVPAPSRNGGEELRRPRHIKPTQENVNDDGEYSLLIVGAGAAAGIEPADVIELIRGATGLSGPEVRRVRVLARFTLVRVPVEKAIDVAKAIDGGSLRGRPVHAEAVAGDS